jgi:NAD(P)-dependent dehydrogenase (short-subunit alcohol dehydrogenase family)
MNMRTALVTGASRGLGRGIAIALGAAGWTVWVTGRSTQVETTSHLPGTIEETAGEVTAAGGLGIVAPCDHRDDDQVRGVVSQLGRLDLLVNNVWAGYERLNAGGWPEWNAPFWEQPIELWDAMFHSGVRAHYVTTALCAPLLRASPRGLIVTVSVALASDTPIAYSVAKTADDQLAKAFATALGPDGVASVALHPGLVRTEGVMQFAEHLNLSGSQSPEGVGRVIAALAVDPRRMSLTGQALHIAELAERYGIDVNY